MVVESVPVKPRAVRNAAILLGISAVLIAGIAVAIRLGVIAESPGGDPTIPSFIASALLGLIAWKIDTGRNWARWLFAVIFVMGTLVSMISFYRLPALWRSMSAPGLVSGAVQVTVQALALIFMFSRESSE